MRFDADENVDGRILDGLRARLPDLDIVRIQDTAMYRSPDEKLLVWLADERRILLTHCEQCRVTSTRVCVMVSLFPA